MSKRGRPDKFHQEIKDAILRYLSIGATYKDAAEGSGISYETLLNWLTKGREATSGNYYEFFQSVRKAEAQARLNYLTTIAQAASKGDWKAAEAYLKRRDRANWGDNVDVTSGGDKITKIVVEWQDDGSEDQTPPTA